MKVKTITIIGLDAIGASVGLALKAAAPEITLIGHDRERATAQAAAQAGAIDQAVWNVVRAASEADLLVLSLPVNELEDTLRSIGRDVKEHTVVIDLARLKQQGVRWAEKHLHDGHYVGAVPVLAATWLDDARRGLEMASAELFQNSVFCVTPSAAADPQAVQTAVNFGRLLGATPFFLDPAEYDSLVQGVEAVPSLMAAALFSAVSKSAGWRDILRFAGRPFSIATLPLRSDEEIPYQVLNDKEATLRWLDALMEELQAMRRWVADGDRETLAALAQQLSQGREHWLHLRTKNEWEEATRAKSDVGLLGSLNLFGGLGRPQRDE